MAHYLTIHNEPELSREKTQARWAQLALERRALWVKTWFNLSAGRRFCWWDAPTQAALEKVFADHGVTWEEIVKVNVTTPSEWRWRDD